MRTLPTLRRIGRVNPSPRAGAAMARLTGRQWWRGGTAADGADVEVSPPVPGDTRWCEIRLLGPGGRAAIDPENTSIAWMGAGGCYARRGAPVRPGQLLALILGGPGFVGSSAAPRATTLAIDGVVVCRAAGGPHASVGAHGAAALASDCLGDVVRLGGPGGATAFHGGQAAGDQADPDSLSLGGVRRQPANQVAPAPFDAGLAQSDFGAGGVAGENTDPGNLWWPRWPSRGVYQIGGPGMAVLEFYDRRPF